MQHLLTDVEIKKLFANIEAIKNLNDNFLKDLH